MPLERHTTSFIESAQFIAPTLTTLLHLWMSFASDL
jgi:hypothetical protein